jgi:hypothetical protein
MPVIFDCQGMKTPYHSSLLYLCYCFCQTLLEGFQDKSHHYLENCFVSIRVALAVNWRGFHMSLLLHKIAVSSLPRSLFPQRLSC